MSLIDKLNKLEGKTPDQMAAALMPIRGAYLSMDDIITNAIRADRLIITEEMIRGELTYRNSEQAALRWMPSGRDSDTSITRNSLRPTRNVPVEMSRRIVRT